VHVSIMQKPALRVERPSFNGRALESHLVFLKTSMAKYGATMNLK